MARCDYTRNTDVIECILILAQLTGDVISPEIYCCCYKKQKRGQNGLAELTACVNTITAARNFNWFCDDVCQWGVGNC